MKSAKLEDLLRARLMLRAFPEFGGMKLWLAHPKSGLGGLAGQLGAGAPYWGFAWPGGLALCHYFFEHPETVADRRVFDFGAGSGIVGIAAHLCGAASVGLADGDPLAEAAFRLNAAENGLKPTAETEAELGPGDLVLAGDVFYDAPAAKKSLSELTRLRGQGAEVLIGDPFRPDLPRQRLTEIARTSVREVGASEAAPAVAAGIFTLEHAF